MPTIPCRPAAQRERERLQTRRLRAAELFAVGVRQAEVARQLQVSAQAVSVWHARWTEGGTAALYSRGPSGPTPRLSEAQLATVEQAPAGRRRRPRVHGRVVDLGPHWRRGRAADRSAPSPRLAVLGVQVPLEGADERVRAERIHEQVG
jgi:hypothetical protein